MAALRRKGFKGKFIVGGYLGTLHDKDLVSVLPADVIIVRGEGDKILPLIVDYMLGNGKLSQIPAITYLEADGTFVRTPKGGLISNLDDLPFPARDTLNDVFRLKNPVISVSPARGCIHRCNFCSITTFHRLSGIKAWRERNPISVVEEIEMILDLPEVQEARADFIWFVSDEFMGPIRNGKTYGEMLASEVLNRGLVFRWEIACRADQVDLNRFRFLHEAGLRSVYLGIESFSQMQLDSFKKETTVEQNIEAINILQKLGISYTLGTIVFNETAAYEDFIKTHKMIKKLGYRHVTMPLAHLKLFVNPSSGAALHIPAPEYKELISPLEYEKLYRLAYRIYDYSFLDNKIKFLDKVLKNVREENEKLVTYVIDMLDNNLIDGFTFWKLVYLLRDSLGNLIDRVIQAIDFGSENADIRKEIFQEIDSVKNELMSFRELIVNSNSSEIKFKVYGRSAIWKRYNRPKVFPGTEAHFAEKEYMESKEKEILL
jgi:radical SAM superfamily enzyme YgiQ (UPF0313 family)